jgi:hypothetical protein
MGDDPDEIDGRTVASRLGMALLVAIPLTAMVLMALMVAFAFLGDLLLALVDVDSDLADQEITAAAIRPALTVTAASAVWLVVVGLATLARRRT